MTESGEVRLLESADIPATAALLAAAMDDDPAYGFLFPRVAERARGLRDLFARNLRMHLPYRCTTVLTDGLAVVGTVTVRPPEGFAITLLTMLRRGLVPYGLAHGASAVRRLLVLKSTYDGIETRLAAGAPHWLVHMMAVEPSRQGHGLGSRLLEQVLATTADSRRAPEAPPTLLTTHKERNVVFYERAGFELMDVRSVSMLDEPPYRVWSMARRRPRKDG